FVQPGLVNKSRPWLLGLAQYFDVVLVSDIQNGQLSIFIDQPVEDGFAVWPNPVGTIRIVRVQDPIRKVSTSGLMVVKVVTEVRAGRISVPAVSRIGREAYLAVAIARVWPTVDHALH